MPYVAKRVLRFGDRDIQPGEIVPEDPHRRYESLLAMGWIEEAPAQSEPEPAPPAPEQTPAQEQAPEPVAEWVCDECDKVFPSEHGLKVHKTRVHWRP